LIKFLIISFCKIHRNSWFNISGKISSSKKIYRIFSIPTGDLRFLQYYFMPWPQQLFTLVVMCLVFSLSHSLTDHRINLTTNIKCYTTQIYLFGGRLKRSQITWPRKMLFLLNKTFRHIYNTFKSYISGVF